jgi:K+-transporting ATPase ATPase A chain
MTLNAWLQILVYFAAILLLAKPLGVYMAKVFEGKVVWLSPVLRPLERSLYRLCGIDEGEDMKWTTYTLALLLFTAIGAVLTFALLRLQGFLPFNPQHFGAKEMPADLAANTAVSFATNTNWQNYTPETTLSYFSNMVALAIHNWMSAATGIAIAIAIIRGFARRTVNGLGSFWVDVVRTTLYVLLPISLAGAIVLVSQGVPQNFRPYETVHAMDQTGATPDKPNVQTIAQGPVASQEVIKELGTNGGGIFNANSAHPFENPNPVTNTVQILLIFLIPAALTITFGQMVGNRRQGWAVFAAMASMFLVGVFVCTAAEQSGSPHLAKANITQVASERQPGGNMEGKEVRFGINSSTLFATVTTDTSTGAVNSMHDSFTPLGGLVPLFNMLTGEVIFGGVGCGLYGMLMFAILAVFIAGLMVGRTPEYLGKKIEKFEVQMAMLATLVLAASVLVFTAINSNLSLPPGKDAQTFTEAQAADEAKLPALAQLNHVNGSSPSNYLGNTINNTNNSGAHGFSEIFYSFASTTGNNGSAFAGLTGNTPIWNTTLLLAMYFGRFLMIVPLLAMAGSLARKKSIPISSGTFATDNATFVVLLVGTVLIVGALTYIPALALGPIVEHFQLQNLKTF